jgi:hypothetical protein
VKTWLLFVLFFAAVPGNEQADPEHPPITTSSDEFVAGTPAALNVLQKSNFEQGLETPGLAASSDQDFQRLVTEINAKPSMPGFGNGTAGIEYDVILQPGHYLRTSGRTGTMGKYVSEQALVAYITSIVAASLGRTGASVLVVSADNYLRPTRVGVEFNGLHSRVFLAIHADGSERPCTTGPSLGYQRPATALTMNFIGLGLADALGYDYASFRKANYTANEAKYYMFHEVRAGRLTGLLEVGELTCQTSERELISSAHAVGANVARAIDFILRTPGAAAFKSPGSLIENEPESAILRDAALVP